jgi:hypothetical protein
MHDDIRLGVDHRFHDSRSVQPVDNRCLRPGRSDRYGLGRSMVRPTTEWPADASNETKRLPTAPPAPATKTRMSFSRGVYKQYAREGCIVPS